ncbi:MAG: peptide chain release factor N(5)-glutamine methyltransferase [Firmicutes bacterium]|nr:peptide chain release factor N(5)-glutamine methyltransferase [Bacillota bacterium]
MQTVKQALKSVKDSLKKANIDTWSIDGDLLVMEAAGLSRMQLVTRDDSVFTAEQEQKLETLLEKRLTYMPMQYILGRCEFMGLMFSVNENVLIPRPDTEILVEKVLEYKPKTVLDIGTGSGAIAVSLAKYGAESVAAVDISEKALETAAKNAALNGVDVKFIKSDIFENVSGSFDAIVSNPPYIVRGVIPTLDRQVKDFEPMLALDGGEDGLDFYKVIVSEAKEHLNANGLLAFEIGYDQGESVSALMRGAGFKDIEVTKDLAGLDRVVTGIKE